MVSIFLGKYLFKKHLYRPSREAWSRKEASDTNDYEQMNMWFKGLEWAEENKDYKTDVDIISDGYHLYGEYYDFKKDKTVIIVPGRTETLRYSYFYAIAYKDIGFNILVIDKRGHGDSEGCYEDGGQSSYVDLHNWARFLKEKFNVEDITLHGICIGSEHCVHAIASKDCPDNIKRIITDGMYSTFKESFKLHMKKDKRSIFPYLQMTMLWAKHYTKSNFSHNGPIYEMDKITKPFLFIYTELDEFSTPKQGKALYEKCASKDKKIVFFQSGRHSHVLYHNKERYEQEIKTFIDEVA